MYRNDLFLLRYTKISIKTIFSIVLWTCVFLYSNVALCDEPFVVLEISNNSLAIQGNGKSSSNKFMKDFNYSSEHTVKKNETLVQIIFDYYGKSNLNRKVLELAIVQANSSAFVRNNPNYMYAGRKLYLPSINEIRDLALRRPGRASDRSSDNNNTQQHIYFFGS